MDKISSKLYLPQERVPVRRASATKYVACEKPCQRNSSVHKDMGISTLGISTLGTGINEAKDAEIAMLSAEVDRLNAQLSAENEQTRSAAKSREEHAREQDRKASHFDVLVEIMELQDAQLATKDSENAELSRDKAEMRALYETLRETLVGACREAHEEVERKRTMIDRLHRVIGDYENTVLRLRQKLGSGW